MRFMVIFLLVFIFQFDVFADTTLRDSMLKNMVNVNVYKDLGRVIYDHSKSRSQFSSVAKKQISKNTLGLTISNLSIEGATEVETSKVAGGYMVYLTNVNIRLSLGDIIVLVDKKYDANSCQYKTIIDHENKHVSTIRMVLDFYAPYVKKEIEKVVQDIEPEITRSEVNATMVNNKYHQKIKRALDPMLELIEEQLDKGNTRLDTDEEYAKEMAKCDSW